ncbi:MAG: pyridoxal-phosphate dependent enzyme [Anaerolineae bacterium]|nr:pyridoxal-phosphate dependent enzyme [Anaerolineae bacterium]
MVTFHDIIAARQHVYRHLRPTPLTFYPGLSKLLDTEVYVKHENHQPIGAFKVRGGVNLAYHLSASERAAGLATASTGNHGQSIAYAGQVTGTPVTVAMPQGANPGKAAAIQALGAEVVFYGEDFDTARLWMETRAAEQGKRWVRVTDELLIAGVGTYALEIVEDLPDVDAIFVPVGGGSGACGCCLVVGAVNPAITVYGCQAAAAPAQQLAWRGADASTAPMKTFAEGVATRIPFEDTQAILKPGLHDFLLVEEADIYRAIVTLLEHTHNLVEGAGAIPLAAALQVKADLQGKKVVLVISGGNLSLARLRSALDYD